MAVAAVPEPPRLEDFLTDVQGHLLLLYRLNNPNNLGAIMRSAHWFGFAGIILSRDSVDFTHPKVVRASMGSLFYLSLIADTEFAEILPRLKERYRLVGSNVRIGVPPHACAKRIALLLGSESHGLPDDLAGMADEVWQIPGTEEAESLSLPQAAAIMMYACTVSS
jgi:TrmH family RNA methyltransferase